MRRTQIRWMIAFIVLGFSAAQWLGADEGLKSLAGWTPGKGWGWIWGPDDEVGALNAVSPASVLAAAQEFLDVRRLGRRGSTPSPRAAALWFPRHE